MHFTFSWYHKVRIRITTLMETKGLTIIWFTLTRRIHSHTYIPLLYDLPFGSTMISTGTKIELIVPIQHTRTPLMHSHSGRYSAECIWKYVSLNGNNCILIHISLIFVIPEDSISYGSRENDHALNSITSLTGFCLNDSIYLFTSMFIWVVGRPDVYILYEFRWFQVIAKFIETMYHHLQTNCFWRS